MQGIRLVNGCNYHTTWQSNPSMRFRLKSMSEDKKTCVLVTNRTNKRFTTKVSDLIFINSAHNKAKADRYEDDKRKASFKKNNKGI